MSFKLKNFLLTDHTYPDGTVDTFYSIMRKEIQNVMFIDSGFEPKNNFNDNIRYVGLFLIKNPKKCFENTSLIVNLFKLILDGGIKIPSNLLKMLKLYKRDELEKQLMTKGLVLVTETHDFTVKKKPEFIKVLDVFDKQPMDYIKVHVGLSWLDVASAKKVIDTAVTRQGINPDITEIETSLLDDEKPIIIVEEPIIMVEEPIIIVNNPFSVDKNVEPLITRDIVDDVVTNFKFVEPTNVSVSQTKSIGETLMDLSSEEFHNRLSKKESTVLNFKKTQKIMYIVCAKGDLYEIMEDVKNNYFLCIPEKIIYAGRDYLVLILKPDYKFIKQSRNGSIFYIAKYIDFQSIANVEDVTLLRQIYLTQSNKQKTKVFNKKLKKYNLYYLISPDFIINDDSSLKKEELVNSSEKPILVNELHFIEEGVMVSSDDVYSLKKEGSVSSGKDPYSSKENFSNTLSAEMNAYCEKIGVFCSFGVKYQGLGLCDITNAHCIKIGDEDDNYGNIEEKTSTDDSIHKKFMGFRCRTLLFGNVMNIIYSLHDDKYVLHEVRIFNKHKIVFQLILTLTIHQRIKIECGECSEERLDMPLIEGDFYNKTSYMDFDENSLPDFIPVINKLLSKY